MVRKMNDQKAKSDAGKPKLSLVPRRIIFDIARIREYGNEKYPEGGIDNWRNVEPERYRDAAFRHFLAYLDDPYGLDAESGFPHLWHLATNVSFLCDLEDSKILNMTRERQIGEVAHGDVIGHKVRENEDGSVTFKVTKEGKDILDKLKDYRVVHMIPEANWTGWTKAWREHDGEAEYCRKNILTGEVQFGDYDFESGEIIPRKE